MRVISVYSQQERKRLAYLENSHDISYEKTASGIWTASFKLPYSDRKRQYCDVFNLVDIFDSSISETKPVGLFRILPITETSIASSPIVQYKAEHVVSFLLDDMMTGFHEIGGQNVKTTQVLNYILEKQTTRRWVLGECDFDFEYLYGWQDENLLSCLFGVTKPFLETDFYWDYDTSIYPWRISLKKIDKRVKGVVRYRKNIQGMKKTIDPSNLVTRLYCYGYGQGDNKLNIKNVNNGQLFIDHTNKAKYGVISQVWTDERITNEEYLLKTGQATLAKLAEPKVTYDIDIQLLKSDSKITIGDTVRVYIPNESSKDMVVQKITKEDVTANPYNGKVVLGDGTIDISNSVASLMEKQRISETYAQGSESIFMDSIADNADTETPAEFTFYIPENAVHINEIKLNCSIGYFRAYSRAVDGGGQDGQTTYYDFGNDAQNEEDKVQIFPSESNLITSSTTESGGANVETTGSGVIYVDSAVSYHVHESSAQSTSTAHFSNDEKKGVVTLNSTSGSDGNHNHGFGSWNKILTTQNPKHGEQMPYSGNHHHTLIIPQHTHTIIPEKHSHSFTVPSHSHSVNIQPHKHDIPEEVLKHTHNIKIPRHKHKWTLPNHTHDIKYGIFKSTSKASKLEVYYTKKDNTQVLIHKSNGDIKDLDLVDLIIGRVSANGSALRGPLRITIKPDRMTRLECSVQVRLFTNMKGGNQY